MQTYNDALHKVKAVMISTDKATSNNILVFCQHVECAWTAVSLSNVLSFVLSLYTNLKNLTLCSFGCKVWQDA